MEAARRPSERKQAVDQRVRLGEAGPGVDQQDARIGVRPPDNQTCKNSNSPAPIRLLGQIERPRERSERSQG